ncbi:DUF1543 domain-containing protein [Anaerotignum sp.]|uniref:DUF1543 domain-containing protein n=1 Tax=Anaerotignum sp. TaxID=2039241 RepID=UPI0028A18528|nr:DUF1543 domain-containing protein [Anaerotignum sp.]
MKNLFVIGIGGSSRKANIEVHDVQLVIADCIENTYETLKEDWYGEYLHLDEYKILTGADGYAIQIADYPQNTHLNLFFINMGGYLKETFGEQHEYGFFVAETEKEAKEKAKKELLKNVVESHVDGVFKVENSLKFADGKTVYIHLNPDGKIYNLNPDWSGYKKLI